MYEILNGIMRRPDYKKLLHIPMGAIPSGSGNSINCDLTEKS